jgi:hypothetical protein
LQFWHDLSLVQEKENMLQQIKTQSLLINTGLTMLTHTPKRTRNKRIKIFMTQMF